MLLINPHHVATWDGDRPTLREIWATDARSKDIERLLFIERGIDRRLRNGSNQYAHPKLNLIRDKRRGIRLGRSLPELTRLLRQVA